MKSSLRETNKEKTILEIANAMSQLYLKCESYKNDDFQKEYSKKLEKERKYIQTCVDAIASIGNGTKQKELLEHMIELQKLYETIYEEAKQNKISSSNQKENFTNRKKENKEALKSLHNIGYEGNITISQQIQEYHNYMMKLKETLQNALIKIEELEVKYETSQRKVDMEIKKLYASFQKEVSIAKINHIEHIQKQFDSREQVLTTFETWNDRQKQLFFMQMAKLSDINKSCHAICQSYVEKINKLVEYLVKQSIISDSQILSSESYFKMNPTQRFKVRPIGRISVKHFNFLEKLEEGNIDLKGGFVEFFQGKEAKLRYIHEKKQKPHIERVLKESVVSICQVYENAIEKQLEELKAYCEDIRDTSCEEELGGIQTIREVKITLQKLIKKDTDFSYTEKHLTDILKNKKY